MVCNSFYIKGFIYNAPLWFLPVLFEIFAIAFILKGFSEKRYVAASNVVISCALGFALYRFDIAFLSFFGFKQAVIMFMFFSLGMLFRTIELDKIRKTYLVSAGIVSWIAAVVFGCFLNTKVSVYAFKLGCYPYFLLSSIGGAAGVIILCYLFFNRNCFLSDCSKYGILFLGTQYFWIVPFNRILTSYPAIHLILLVALMSSYIFLFPVFYEKIVSIFPKLKVLNGET